MLGFMVLFKVGHCFGKTHSVGKTFRKNPFRVWENLFFVLGCSCAFRRLFINCGVGGPFRVSFWENPIEVGVPFLVSYPTVEKPAFRL